MGATTAKPQNSQPVPTTSGQTPGQTNSKTHPGSIIGLHFPIIGDFIIWFSQCAFLGVVSAMWFDRKSYCGDYKSGGYTDFDSCDDDKWCRRYNTFYDDWGKTWCSDSESFDHDCTCYPEQEIYALYVSYSVFFSFTCLLEFIKWIIVVDTCNNGCCCNCGGVNGLYKTKCIRHLNDSMWMYWTGVFDRNNWTKFKDAFANGEVLFFPWIHVFTLMFRTIPLTVIMFVSIGREFNGWFVIWLIGVLAYCWGKIVRWRYNATHKPIVQTVVVKPVMPTVVQQQPWQQPMMVQQQAMVYQQPMQQNNMNIGSGIQSVPLYAQQNGGNYINNPNQIQFQNMQQPMQQPFQQNNISQQYVQPNAPMYNPNVQKPQPNAPMYNPNVQQQIQPLPSISQQQIQQQQTQENVAPPIAYGNILPQNDGVEGGEGQVTNR